MNFKIPSKWLAACLYYNEPWEEFLVKAVKPYVDVVKQTGAAERFYFQRSWEQGPNIRLFFKSGPDILDSIIKPYLEEHFNQYFEARPSLRIDPKFPESSPHPLKWLPNNSVQYQEHQPPIGQLGSELAWEISEKQFEASSLMALKSLKTQSECWTYNEMMSTAIKLHLSMAAAMGMSMDEASSFFHLLSKKWESRNLQKEGITAKQADITLRSFQKIFDIQRKDIVPYHIALWEMFKNHHRIEDDGFVHWFNQNNDVGLELEMAIEIGKIKPLPQFGSEEAREEYPREQLWGYLSEYILLTNNRLGIHHKHEGYLLYVLNQSLRKKAAKVFSYAKAAV